MDKVVADVDVFSMIVKLRVIGELHSSLIIHADRSRRREDRGLPLHRRIIVMLLYVRRMGLDIMSFNFAEELPHPDDLFRGLGEGDILHLGRGQGDNVLLLSFPRDCTSAENDDEAAGRPALVSIPCPV